MKFCSIFVLSNTNKLKLKIMTTTKIIQKLEIEVKNLEEAKTMWQRILKAVFSDKLGYNQAYYLGRFLENKFGSIVLN